MLRCVSLRCEACLMQILSCRMAWHKLKQFLTVCVCVHAGACSTCITGLALLAKCFNWLYSTSAEPFNVLQPQKFGSVTCACCVVSAGQLAVHELASPVNYMTYMCQKPHLLLYRFRYWQTTKKSFTLNFRLYLRCLTRANFILIDWMHKKLFLQKTKPNRNKLGKCQSEVQRNLLGNWI